MHQPINTDLNARTGHAVFECAYPASVNVCCLYKHVPSVAYGIRSPKAPRQWLALPNRMVKNHPVRAAHGVSLENLM